MLTFLESLVLGFLAIREGPRNRGNLLFALYAFSVAASCFVEYHLVTSGSVPVFLFWKRFDFFMYFATATFFHFCLVLNNRPAARVRLWSRTIYGFYVIVAAMECFVLRPETALPGRWSYLSVYPAAYLHTHSAFVVVTSILAAGIIVQLFICKKNAADARRRAQAASLFWSALALVAVGVTAEVGVAIVARTEQPLSITATTAFFLVNPFLAWAVIRYDVLKLSPESLMGDVFELLTDGVIITDRTGIITYANATAGRLTGVPAATLVTLPFDSLKLKNDEGSYRGDLGQAGRTRSWKLQRTAGR